MIPPVLTVPGDSALVLGQPHGATALGDVEESLNARGRAVADTDWHIPALYDGLAPDATVIRAGFSRYVLDVNRDPSGASLYPGQNTTGLCPVIDFEGEPIYREGREPDEAEIERRRQQVHAPYHAAMEAQIARVRAQNGAAVLYDCHSIRGDLPFLFEGRLPDLNIGTNGGASCAPEITAILEEWRGEAEAAGFTTVMNGRFKGGWTTRHYGRPEEGVHAVQMEIVQGTYMEETPPWTYDSDRAAKLRPLLQALLTRLKTTGAGAAAN
ncbi:MAG: N-formylglutamate deformylase [Euryhalocaulis sp.]|uniref:N-formylglutamate deformylase n=1 Tax=Euryhalocaulis sp. TaxID=2744307 RepID=UPI001822B445|nr:N-formylglutamate deformylase [Euryhalocaulis sp.]MBA4801961.1 N-formylglutamate deformylase [Euryhalocaulis sp.]